jgi:acyl-homoserine-lactone acylase
MPAIGATSSRLSEVARIRSEWYACIRTCSHSADVSGAGLLGSPAINIGHTSTFAWSHTVATGVPFSLTELRLVPGDPTSYFVDGKKEKLTRRQVTVQAKQQDGSLKPVTRTLWRSRYGPLVTSVPPVDLPWTTWNAYALTDPNATNVRLANTSLALSKARTTDDALRALTSVSESVASAGRPMQLHAILDSSIAPSVPT